jgi:hypothetical protein
MYIILGVIALVVLCLGLYFFVFKKKKDDDNGGSGSGTKFGGSESGTTFDAPGGGSGGDVSGGASSIDVHILDNMGNDGNNLIVSALSLRRQRSGWTGPIVRLSRVIAGQTQVSEFKATADGTKLVNDANEGLDAWLNARLVVWFDQSGKERHATPGDSTVTLIKTPPKSGVPSFYAFDMSNGYLNLASDQNTETFNNISIYSDSAPKLNVDKLVQFGSTPVNTIFVFSSNIDSNYKDFLIRDRNPSLIMIPNARV